MKDKEMDLVRHESLNTKEREKRGRERRNRERRREKGQQRNRGIFGRSARSEASFRIGTCGNVNDR
jgi:hypothetical protein